jgi:hypothetical protein
MILLFHGSDNVIRDLIHNLTHKMSNDNIRAIDWVESRGGSIVRLAPDGEQLAVLLLHESACVEAVDVIGKMQGVCAIWMEGSPINDDFLLRLSQTDLSMTLSAIRARRTELSNTGIDALSGFPNLRHFAVAHSRLTDGAAVALSNCSGLLHLELTKSSFGDSGFRTLRLPELKHLDLSNTAVSDNSMFHLLGFSRLINVVLSSCAITDASVEHIKHLVNLQCLVLDNTAITDAGLEQLLDLPNLRELMLAGTNVTDDFVVASRSMHPHITMELADF